MARESTRVGAGCVGYGGTGARGHGWRGPRGTQSAAGGHRHERANNEEKVASGACNTRVVLARFESFVRATHYGPP